MSMIDLVPATINWKQMSMIDIVPATINWLSGYCFKVSSHAGWHNEKIDLRKLTPEEYDYLQGLQIAAKLGLIHSEVSEALEGHRKDQMDDHLPHRKMIEVELADAMIRIFDLAGKHGYDLGNAIVEKVEYNKHRADHKISERNKPGGKKF